ncbi:hypothetical protein AAULR_26781, partial [Lacticaseibacillus rhamnosus MTCC 5462]
DIMKHIHDFISTLKGVLIMSRSFKKHPVVKDWHQGMKQRTNRSLRAKMKRGELDDLLRR